MGCCSSKQDSTAVVQPPTTIQPQTTSPTPKPSLSQLKQKLIQALQSVSAGQNKCRDKASTSEGKFQKAIDAPRYERSDYQQKQLLKDATYYANLVVLHRIARADLDKFKENFDDIEATRTAKRLQLPLANLDWINHILDMKNLRTFIGIAKQLIGITANYKPEDILMLHYKNNDYPNDALMTLYAEDLGRRKPQRAQQVEEVKKKITIEIL